MKNYTPYPLLGKSLKDLKAYLGDCVREGKLPGGYRLHPSPDGETVIVDTKKAGNWPSSRSAAGHLWRTFRGQRSPWGGAALFVKTGGGFTTTRVIHWDRVDHSHLNDTIDLQLALTKLLKGILAFCSKALPPSQYWRLRISRFRQLGASRKAAGVPKRVEDYRVYSRARTAIECASGRRSWIR
jgi:hypothetical protein